MSGARNIPMQDFQNQSTSLLSRNESRGSDKGRGMLYILSCVAILTFAGLIVWLFKLTASLPEGCFTHRGVNFCPGDCLLGDLISEERYCPDEGELPMLMYEITENDNAICNDGSKAQVHVRPSVSDRGNENKWVFRFEGGDMCHSKVTCEYRQQEFFEKFFVTAPTNAVMYQDTFQGGIMSGSPVKNPDFYDWNAVHTHYCSSDAYSGNAWPEDNELGWYFQGHEIMKGAFQQAHADFGLGDATHILVHGFSAGGVGMLVGLDSLHDFIQALAPGAAIRYVGDSVWFMESLDVHESYTANCDVHTQCPYRDQMQEAYELWQPVLSESCLSQNKTWECMVMEHVVQDLARRDLVTFLQPQYDHRILSMIGDEEDPALLEFMCEAAETILASLQENAYSYSSSNCCNHDALNRDWFNTMAIDGVTAAQFLLDFMATGDALIQEDPTYLADGSTAKNTNPTCPPNSCYTSPDNAPPHID